MFFNYFFLFSIISLILFFIFKAVEPQYFSMFRERLFGTQFSGLVPDTRIEVWQLAWDYITLKKQYLLGHGPARTSFGFRNFTPHSLHLDVLMRYGVFTLIAMIIFFLLIFFRNRKVLNILKKNKDSLFAPFAFIDLSFIIFMVDQIKVEFTRRPNYELLVWIYFGILIAVQNMVIKKYSQPKNQIKH